MYNYLVKKSSYNNFVKLTNFFLIKPELHEFKTKRSEEEQTKVAIDLLVQFPLFAVGVPRGEVKGELFL